MNFFEKITNPSAITVSNEDTYWDFSQLQLLFYQSKNITRQELIKARDNLRCGELCTDDGKIRLPRLLGLLHRYIYLTWHIDYVPIKTGRGKSKWLEINDDGGYITNKVFEQTNENLFPDSTAGELFNFTINHGEKSFIALAKKNAKNQGNLFYNDVLKIIKDLEAKADYLAHCFPKVKIEKGIVSVGGNLEKIRPFSNIEYNACSLKQVSFIEEIPETATDELFLKIHSNSLKTEKARTAFGYSFAASVCEKGRDIRSIFLLGKGGDGKSFFFETLNTAMPSLFQPLSKFALIEQNYNAGSPIKNFLKTGAIMGYADEMGGNNKVSVEDFKQVTAGNHIHENVKGEGENTSKMDSGVIMAANTLPKINRADVPAILDRLAIFFFETIPDEVRNQTRADNLLQSEEYLNGAKIWFLKFIRLYIALRESGKVYNYPEFVRFKTMPDLPWAYDEEAEESAVIEDFAAEIPVGSFLPISEIKKRGMQGRLLIESGYFGNKDSKGDFWRDSIIDDSGRRKTVRCYIRTSKMVKEPQNLDDSSVIYTENPKNKTQIENNKIFKYMTEQNNNASHSEADIQELISLYNDEPNRNKTWSVQKKARFVLLFKKYENDNRFLSNIMNRQKDTQDTPEPQKFRQDYELKRMFADTADGERLLELQFATDRISPNDKDEVQELLKKREAFFEKHRKV